MSEQTFVDAVNLAIHAEKAIRIVYQDKAGEVSQRDISPLEWLIDDRVLRAWCHLRDAERTFQVSGVQWYELLDSQPEPEPPLDGVEAELEQLRRDLNAGPWDGDL